MPITTALRQTNTNANANAASPAATVTVKSGDTLSAIATRHGLNLEALLAHNPQVKNPDLILPGQVLALPTAAATTASAATTPATTTTAPATTTTAPAPTGATAVDPQVQRDSRSRSAGAEQAIAARIASSALTAPSTTSTGATSATSVTSGASISERGQAQMQKLVQHARANHAGGSHGRCMEYVWRYMTTSGYGKLDQWGDLPRMNGALARGLPDYLNASPAHLKEAGLQRLDTALNPPIRNPHDHRIPAGAVIVVAPGSTGTSHATAGDIVVKGTRPGEFINDGPRMSYGSHSGWQGRILGVYVPE
jgi:hypothetical protein